MICRCLVVSLTLLVLPLALVSAATFKSVIVTPSKLEITALPGEIIRREFVINNQTDNDLDIVLRFGNLASSTDWRDGASLAEDLTPVSPLTPYLSATKWNFVTRRGERVIVPIIIKLPKDLGPGGFYGAAIFSITSANRNLAGTKMITRLAPLIFLRVNGEIKEAGALISFNFSRPTFYLTYQNTGNIYLNPYGLIEVKNKINGQQINLPVDPWFVLPGATRVREISMEEKIPVGWYQATISLNRGFSDLIDKKSFNFVVFPPLATTELGLGIAAFLVFIILVIVKKRRGRIVLPLILILVLVNVVQAQVASSPNYRLQADSLNFGGQLSNSSNYRLEDTLGEIATGNGASTNYNLLAGYQQMISSSLAITAPSDVSLSGIVGTGASSGSVGWTVTTDNPAGYTLSIKAGNSPALVSGSDSFSDYSPSGATPDYEWSVGAGAAAFGFSPEGTDIASRYLDNGAACGTGGAGDSVNHCWDGFSAANRTIASRTTSNTPSGITTTVKLKAEIGSAKTQPVGSYVATLTVTATPR